MNLTMIDVIRAGAYPRKETTMDLISKLGDELAAKGPLFTDAQTCPELRPAYHRVRDMPRCEWYGQHRYKLDHIMADGTRFERCMDCITRTRIMDQH
jgi:hypothetical protein